MVNLKHAVIYQSLKYAEHVRLIPRNIATRDWVVCRREGESIHLREKTFGLRRKQDRLTRFFSEKGSDGVYFLMKFYAIL